jgi:hypothetical protein
MMRVGVGMAVLAGVVLLTVPCASAGPITPPPGPVEATYKSLTEIEPRTAINATNTPGDADSVFKITQSGSYYLAGRVVGQAGRAGIEIAASNVTIDLNGFEVVGSTGTLSGISASSGFDSVSVSNGIVSGWSAAGVALQGIGARAERVESNQNGTIGFNLGSNAIISGCIARENGSVGFQVSTGGVISDCIAATNTGVGISANARCVVMRCAAEGNGSDGIVGTFGAQILDCVSGSNAGNGITVSNGCMVARCTASTNGASGIATGVDALIIGNACDGNGTTSTAAGILIGGADCRVEGNLSTDNDWGIRATLAGSFIARNTCSGNTTLNWDIFSGNICLVVSATTAGAISGNSGGAAPGSTDPSVNFTY